MREDWGVLKLEDLSKRITKGATPTSYGFDFQNKGINFLKVENVKGGIIDVNTIRDFISIEAYNYLAKSQLESGDILFSIAGTIGNICLVKENILPANTNQAFAIIKGIYKEVLTDFVMWQLKYFVDKIKIKSRGGAMMNVSLQDLKDFQIIISPITEQRAIVKKLESLFSSLDEGVADLKKAQQQLKIYRQAVLKKAFEGITETIILNDAGAWKGGGTPSTQNKDFWENGNINWVSSQDVKTKYIEDTERKITSIAINNSSTKWIEKNALLFVVRSGILRRIFPIAIAKVDLCVNQDIQTLTLNEKYLTEFVYWYLMGNEYDIRHNCAKDGTTVESIDVSKLKKYKLPTCKLDKQKEIVKQIESRLSVCDSIEQNIKESLIKAEALRQSILKKGFDGNLLTAQELTECKKAADYEPAGVLLERIKADKIKK